MDFSQQSQVEYECRLAGEGWILRQGAPRRPPPALVPVPLGSLRWGPQGKALQLVLTDSPVAPTVCFHSPEVGKVAQTQIGLPQRTMA